MNNTETLKARLEELETERTDIINKMREEQQKNILPLLQQHAICIWDTLGHCKIVFEDTEIENRVIKYVADSEWSYSGRCDIDEVTHINYHDGDLTLSFDFNGFSKDIEDRAVKHLLKLNLKVSFDNHIRNLQSEINRYTTQLNDVLEYDLQCNLTKHQG